MSSALILEFKDKDSEQEISRDTLTRLAEKLSMTETAVVHLAIANMARATLPAYESDDGQVDREMQDWVEHQAQSQLPKGKVLSRKSLL
jgi:hypothetical protein